MSGRKLVIFDEYFPMESGFRTKEFVTYLEAFPDSTVLSMGGDLPWDNDQKSFAGRMKAFESSHPELASRVLKYSSSQLGPDSLVYCIFLSGISQIIEDLDRLSAPFIFTLYPGGGFFLDNPDADAKLERVFRSPNLRSVITTQALSRKYIQDKFGVPDEKITHIFGGTLDCDRLRPKPKYATIKSDICFVANKYMPGGLDKGYDIFCEVAKIVHARRPHSRFHVVGHWEPADGDLGEALADTKFYGMQETEFFPEFHSLMDLIIAPNRTNVLRPGKFDGFPSGCCVEAALCGTAVFTTDPHDENRYFEPDKEIVIIDESPEHIAEKVLSYLDQPAYLAAIAAAGEKRCREIYSYEAQLQPRLDLIAKQLEAKPKGFAQKFWRKLGKVY